MNTEFMTILVQSVEQYPFIWDNCSPQYNNRELADKAWRDISDYCEQPVRVCKTKWKNVRTGFLRSLMKNRRFHLYDALKFLLPVFRRNEAFVLKMHQFEKNMDEKNESEIVKIEDSSSEILNDDELEECDNSTDEANRSERYFSQFGLNSTKQETSTISLKREGPSIILDDSCSSSAKIAKITSTNDEVNMTNKDEEALMSFFKGIASDVLSLPVQQQRLFKRKIVEVIDDLHSDVEKTDCVKCSNSANGLSFTDN